MLVADLRYQVRPVRVGRHSKLPALGGTSERTTGLQMEPEPEGSESPRADFDANDNSHE